LDLNPKRIPDYLGPYFAQIRARPAYAEASIEERAARSTSPRSMR
jgi:hypothetical protein